MSTSITNGARTYRGKNRGAFTLTELLVVMAVISIMASLLLSALSSAKEKSRAMMCRSNMKQLTIAFNMYADENEDYYPWPGGDPDRANKNAHYAPDWCAGGQTQAQIQDPTRWSDDSFGFHAEAGSIFPYVLSRQRIPYSEKHKEVYPIYRCPSTGRLGEALRVNYAANQYLDPMQPFGDGYVGENGVLTTSVVDPVRKVLLVNEDPRRLSGAGFAPSANSVDGNPILHLGKVNVSFVDGHTEALSSRFVETMQTEGIDTYYNLGSY